MQLPGPSRLFRGVATAGAAALLVAGAAFAAQGVVAPAPVTTPSLPGGTSTGPGAGTTHTLVLAGAAAEPTETPEATETPEPTETPEATGTPEPTETPEATGTPEPTETPEATETPEPTETPEAGSGDNGQSQGATAGATGEHDGGDGSGGQDGR